MIAKIRIFFCPNYALLHFNMKKGDSEHDLHWRKPMIFLTLFVSLYALFMPFGKIQNILLSLQLLFG